MSNSGGVRFATWAIILFLCSGMFLFSQERFVLSESDAKQFKLAKQLFYKGQQLFFSGKIKKAKDAFDECIKVFPQYSEAYFYLAQVYYKENDFAKAEESLLAAKNHYKFMSDLMVSTQLEYMDLLREQKQAVQENIRSLETLLARSKSPNERAEIQGNITSQRAILSEIDSRNQSPVPGVPQIPADYYYVHGNILFKLKKYNQALDQYQETVRLNPKHGSACNNIANLLYMARQYEKALTYLDQAEAANFKVNPDFRKAILAEIEKLKK